MDMDAVSSSSVLIIIKQTTQFHDLDFHCFENVKTKINLEFWGFYSIVNEDVQLNQTMQHHIPEDWNPKIKLLIDTALLFMV
jgi:hypothetical protein